jgi:hypothetical protein
MAFKYKVDFYSSIKNEILLFAGKWVDLENIILSEVSQVQRYLHTNVYQGTIHNSPPMETAQMPYN